MPIMFPAYPADHNNLGAVFDSSLTRTRVQASGSSHPDDAEKAQNTSLDSDMPTCAESVWQSLPSSSDSESLLRSAARRNPEEHTGSPGLPL